MLKHGTHKESDELVLMDAIATRDPSGAIERQESRGQTALVNSATLPVKCIGCKPEQLAAAGIIYGPDVDSLFADVALPPDWKKEATDHGMWSKLLDHKGRERASIFYKAAFYDRDAHIRLVCRFSFSIDPVCGYSNPDYRKHGWHCVVTDCGKIVWESSERVAPEPPHAYGDEDGRLAWLGWHNDKQALGELGEQWLAENYPDWKNPVAYWD